MKIVFVLPGRGRSGGVRVTVEMANLLLSVGHDVRIAWRRPRVTSKAELKLALNEIARRIRGFRDTDWLKCFEGKSEPYSDLSQIMFEKGEIVVAVGAMTVESVYGLDQLVVKLRYCHGFSSYRMELMKIAWGVPMTTIAVSHTLVPKLEELSGEKVLGVVPNGHKTEDYYDEGLGHDGIGMVFSTHTNKAPGDALALLKQIRSRWPSIPLYVFGEPRRPREIPRESYWRFPSISKTRELYSRSKIWLLTSRDEGLPAPPLEAMSCGCAVISTDNLGCREIIEHGENGFLVSIGDIDGFMKYIELLLTSEERRIRLVRAGKETLKRFTWENAVSKMEKVLKSIAVG